MIDCLTIDTAHLYGTAMAAQHRLRHRVFVDRLGWSVPAYDGMEYDQFDTPAAVYLVWRDEVEAVRGVARLVPTDAPNMLREVWPDKVGAAALPRSRRVWEGSRLCVDQDLDARERKRGLVELLAGCLEFGLMRGIDRYLIVAPMAILKRSYAGCGCTIDMVGRPWRSDGHTVAAASCLVSEEVLAEVRRRNDLAGPVLREMPRGPLDRAA